jgi:hypothetical protein
MPRTGFRLLAITQLIYIKGLNVPTLATSDDDVKPQIYGVNCGIHDTMFNLVAGRELNHEGKISSDGNVFMHYSRFSGDAIDEDAERRAEFTLKALSSAMHGNRGVKFVCLTSKAHPDDNCKVQHPEVPRQSTDSSRRKLTHDVIVL